MSTQDGGNDKLEKVKKWLQGKIDDNTGGVTEAEKVMYKEAKEWVNLASTPHAEAKNWEPCYIKTIYGKYIFFRKDPDGLGVRNGNELVIDMANNKVEINNADGSSNERPNETDMQNAKYNATIPYDILDNYCPQFGWNPKLRRDNYRKRIKLGHIIKACKKSALEPGIEDDKLCHRYVKPGRWYLGRCKKVGNNGEPTERPIICLDLTTAPFKAEVITREGSRDITLMTYGEFHKHYKKIYKESLWEKFKDHVYYSANKPRITAGTMPKTKSDTFLKILGCAITPFMALYEGAKSGYRALKEMNSEIDEPKEKMPVSDNDSEDLKNAIKAYNDEVEKYNNNLKVGSYRNRPGGYRFNDLKKVTEAREAVKRAEKDAKRRAKNQHALMNTNTVNPTANITNTQSGS